MKRFFQLAPLVLSLLLEPLSPIVLRAQVDRTAITGTVTDQQGNRVPQSAVRATEKATGFQREMVTTSTGTYELPGLPPGVYSVQFSKAGFAAFTAEGVEQVVGQTRTLNARLELAHGKDQTTVTEPLVQLDKVDATMGAAIEVVQVDDLPVNGRNWATLTALAPGAINNGAGDQRTIRFAGHGLDDNNLTLDGVDATAVYNQEQREYMRLNIPLDSIEEFQVQSQNFGADTQSGTAGGQVSVVSPSGTNSFHAQAFDYFRNNALDARSPFDTRSPAPFLLNQFGGAFGHVFNLSAVYRLPFGAGRRYLSNPGVVRTILGGWSLSTIASTQTGLPFDITVDRSNGSVPGNYAISGEERPNYVYGAALTPPGGSTPAHWINPAAFSIPASGTFGNLGRNAFRARSISDVDLALARDISLSERTSIRFRADAFNVLNRAQYGAPNADFSQTNFGVITTTISSYATGRGTPREFQLSAKISF